MSENKDKIDTEKVTNDFFKDVKYYIIGDIEERVRNLLNDGGGKQEYYMSEMITHVIADDASEDDYNEAKEIFELTVVTSQWVTLSVKCGKQLPTTAFSPDTGQIFFGITACPSQVSSEDLKVIWAYITFYGGKCQLKLDQNVTHLICHKPEGIKYERALRRSGTIRIVNPDWVTESVTHKAKLDEERFHPRLLIVEEPEPTPPPSPKVEPPPEPKPEPAVPPPSVPAGVPPVSVPGVVPHGPRHVRPPMSMGPRHPHVSPPGMPRPGGPGAGMPRYPGMPPGAMPRMRGMPPGMRPGLHGMPPGMPPTSHPPGMPPHGMPPHSMAPSGMHPQHHQGGMTPPRGITPPMSSPRGITPPMSSPQASPHHHGPQSPGAAHPRPSLSPGVSHPLAMASRPHDLPLHAAGLQAGAHLQQNQPHQMQHPFLQQQQQQQQQQQLPHMQQQMMQQHQQQLQQEMALQQQQQPQGLESPKTPKGETSRTKEAIFRMVNSRLQASGRVMDSPEAAAQMMMPGMLPGMPGQPPPQQPGPPGPPGMSPGMRPSLPSPGGSAPGSNPTSPRAMLRNITNSGQGPDPKSPSRTNKMSPGRSALAQQLHQNMGLRHPFMQQQQQQQQQQQLQQQQQQQLQQQQAQGHPGLPQMQPQPQQPPQQQPLHHPPQPEMPIYYGHDPIETIPGPLCLLGCFFFITDYQKYLETSQIETWKKVIDNHGGVVDDSYSNRITHVLCEHQKSDVFQMALHDQKRLVTAHWLNDVLLKKKMVPPWRALHFPSPYGQEKPCKNQIICVTNYDGDERAQIKNMISAMGAKYTGYMTSSNSLVVCKKAQGLKYNKAVEWRLSVVNVQWLNDILLGHLDALKLPLPARYTQYGLEDEFRVEVWRVQHLLEGWKMPLRISRDTWKRFGPSHLLKHQEAEKRKADAENRPPPAKRPKLEPAYSLNGDGVPVVLMTGIPPVKAEMLAQQVEKLGGHVTSEPKGATHLVTDAISRTVKFLCGINIVKHVVRPMWIEQSAMENKFLDENNFILRDNKTEVNFSFSLLESLQRARRKPLFKGMIFYLTPSVRPKRSVLKDIIVSAGGAVAEKMPSIKTINMTKTPEGMPAFIVITCDKDLYLCRDLLIRRMGVHNVEFVLTGIMKQEVNYNSFVLSPVIPGQ